MNQYLAIVQTVHNQHQLCKKTFQGLATRIVSKITSLR